MKSRLFAIVAVSMISSAVVLSAQVVVFNEPTAWITQRSDSLVIKAQIDTAQLKKKDVVVAVSRVTKGKSSLVARKSYKIDDLSKDFDLGMARASLIGGYDFLKAEWSIPGTKESGVCAPFGIVDLSKLPKAVVVQARKLTVIDEAGLAAIPGDAFQSLDGEGICLVSSEKEVGIVVKKGPATDKVMLFCFDGKNGKNAFLSYPDRMVRYAPAKDSTAGVRIERSLKGDSISYVEKRWDAEISAKQVGSYFVMKIPLFDLGVVAFKGRTMGFAAFSIDKDNKSVSTLPSGAVREIPGTWGDLILTD